MLELETEIGISNVKCDVPGNFKFTDIELAPYWFEASHLYFP